MSGQPLGGPSTDSSNTYNVCILPSTKSGGRLNGNTLFTLQVHGIHFGSNSIFSAYVMDGIDATCVVENAFRQRRLATSRMGGTNQGGGVRTVCENFVAWQVLVLLPSYLSIWAEIPILRWAVLTSELNHREADRDDDDSTAATGWL